MNIRMALRTLFSHQTPFFITTPALIWQLLFLYIPCVLVFFLSVIQSSDQHYLTFNHYSTVFDPLFFLVIARSLVLAVSNAAVCVLVAFPVAYYVSGKSGRSKNILLFLVTLPFWINFLVQAYAWFFILEKHGLLNSLLLKLGFITAPLHLLNTSYAIYLVMLYCYVPFAFMPIYSNLEKFDTKLLEASSDLGATPWQTFIRVTLPLSARGIRTAFFLVLVPSFGEFVIPTLLGGGKSLYVGSLISHYFLAMRNFNVGAAFTYTSGCILIISALLVYIVFNYVFPKTTKAE